MRKNTLLVVALLLLKSFCLYSQVVTVSGPVNQISINQSETLIALNDGESVTVFDTADFTPVCILDEEKVSKTAFYSEGDNESIVMISEDGQFSVRKIMKENDYWFYDPEEPFFSADCSDSTGRRSLSAVSFSPNTDFVAAAFSDNSIQVHFRLRVTQSSITKTIKSHKAKVYGLEFSRTGDFLASVSADGAAYIWNTSTGAKIAQIKGVYTRSKVPVRFTEDSLYIVSQSGRNSFRISDFSGNTLYSVVTGRPITDIRPLKDSDFIAVRNDNNEVIVYSISAKRPLSITKINSEIYCTSFEYDAAADVMYAGFRDGRLFVYEPEPYLDDSSMVVTDASVEGVGNVSHLMFSSITASGGVALLTEPYLLSLALRGEYLYSEKISPFFAGGGLDFSFGIPRSNFPATYRIRGKEVGAPKLFSLTLYAPAGYAFSLGKDMRILTSFKAGAKFTSLALFTPAGQVLDTPYASFFMGAGVGVRIKFIEANVNLEYDTLGKFSPSLYAGYVWRWGESL